jgi:putative ABC transport system permease protein
VDSTSITARIPGNGLNTEQFELEGSPSTDASLRPSTGMLTVGAEYFSVIRVLPQAGRAFLATDGIGGTPVAVVNRGFVQSYFKGEKPVGKRVRLLDRSTPQRWLTIVGVVPDIAQTDFSHTKSEPMLYQPFRQEPQRMMHVVALTRVAPGSLGDSFRRALQTIDPDLPAREVTTLDDRLALSSWPLRVFGGMFAIFAGIALLLASVGLYAVVAHMVSQRTHEIGVRVALGASQSTILRLVFTQGMRLMGIGLAIGLGAAVGITRVLASLLVGVSPTDPLTLGTVALVLILAAVAGCAVPAHRAIRTDPVLALRHE